MCEDWELGTLFLREAERLGSEEKEAESVRNKFLGELCREDKDTRFFMGARFPCNVWLVAGILICERISVLLTGSTFIPKGRQPGEATP
ncbi:MAG: hypothetical protein WD468_06480 [Pirellulales bacterium]